MRPRAACETVKGQRSRAAQRLAVEAKATAILCLQSEDCLRSLNVPMVELKERCLAEKLLHVCVAVRDFDKDDQAAM